MCIFRVNFTYKWYLTACGLFLKTCSLPVKLLLAVNQVEITATVKAKKTKKPHPNNVESWITQLGHLCHKAPVFHNFTSELLLFSVHLHCGIQYTIVVHVQVMLIWHLDMKKFGPKKFEEPCLKYTPTALLVMGGTSQSCLNESRVSVRL